jgi:predicted GNAT superfamily acetyltransferase
MAPGAQRDDVTDRAHAAARRAAAAAGQVMRTAGIEIRPAETPDDIHQVRQVLDAVFKPAPGESEASHDLLMAMARTGQYLVTARPLHNDDLALGTGLAFFCAPDMSTLHSHVIAVLAASRGSHVGWALKLHQRAWAMARGLDTITWTFDPLIRRNAWFNLVKLGARPTAFAVDFYGAIYDAVNDGDETDRFVLAWRLWSDWVVAACDGAPFVAPVAGMLSDGVPRLLETGPGDVPVRASLPQGAKLGLAQVPSDIESMRAADPALALRWRRDLRAVLTDAADCGLDIVGMGRDGWYVLGSAALERDEGGRAESSAANG